MWFNFGSPLGYLIIRVNKCNTVAILLGIHKAVRISYRKFEYTTMHSQIPSPYVSSYYGIQLAS